MTPTQPAPIGTAKAVSLGAGNDYMNTLPTDHNGDKQVPALMALWNQWLYWIRDSNRKHAETRRAIRLCHSEINRKTGKGNRAWKRADANERAWRANGGFYLSDLVTP